MSRLVKFLLFFLAWTLPGALVAQTLSPFEGVWGGRQKSVIFNHPVDEFQFRVDENNQLLGTWMYSNGINPLSGVVEGNKVRGHVDIEHGADFEMELLQDGTIKFRVVTFLGEKYVLHRLSKMYAEQPAGTRSLGTGGHALVAIAGMGGQPMILPDAQRAISADGATCDGFPIQTHGEGPAGTVCRCSYGGPSNRLGWWAVRPGEPSGGVVACSGPVGSLPERVATPGAMPSFPQQPAQRPQLPPSSGKYAVKTANHCVYIDRSNSLGDFIGNRCAFSIAVWFCVQDPGHSFQCGKRGGNGVYQLTHVPANNRDSTLKAKNYHWFACGEAGVDALVVHSDHRWDGQDIRGNCYRR